MMQDVEIYENPLGISNNKQSTSLNFCSIAMAIQKKLHLVSCSLSLFLEKKQFLEDPYIKERKNNS